MTTPKELWQFLRVYGDDWDLFEAEGHELWAEALRMTDATPREIGEVARKALRLSDPKEGRQ